MSDLIQVTRTAHGFTLNGRNVRTWDRDDQPQLISVIDAISALKNCCYSTARSVWQKLSQDLTSNGKITMMKPTRGHTRYDVSK